MFTCLAANGSWSTIILYLASNFTTTTIYFYNRPFVTTISFFLFTWLNFNSKTKGNKKYMKHHSLANTVGKLFTFSSVSESIKLWPLPIKPTRQYLHSVLSWESCSFSPNNFLVLTEKNNYELLILNRNIIWRCLHLANILIYTHE